MSNELVNALGSIMVIACYSLLFILWGDCITSRFLKKKPNDQVVLGMSFFLGATSMISLWCYSEMITGNAALSLLLSTLFFILFLIYNARILNFGILKQFLKIKKPIYLLVVVAFSFFFFFARIYPINFNMDAHLGSGSTQLYFNKALFYYKENIIPRSTNSIGQSLLAAIPLFLGFAKSGILNLFTWMLVGIIFFTLFIYGFLKEIGFTKKQCYLGTFFLVFGNMSLSVLPATVIDSGMPLVYVNYAHSIITLMTFFIFLSFCYYYLKNVLEVNASFILLTILVVTSWFNTSPENVVIGLPFIVIFIGYLYRTQRITVKKVWTLAVFVFVLIFVGISRGGLLSPPIFRDIAVEKHIPGYQESPFGAPFTFTRPGLDYGINFALDIAAFQYPKGSRFHINERTPEAATDSSFTGSFTINFMKKFSTSGFRRKIASTLLFEYETWNALKVLFIPIFGVLSLMVIARKNNDETLKIFSIGSALAFAGGFTLAFFSYQDGIKWPFTRFLLPGIIPAQLCFYISLVLIVNKLNFVKFKKSTIVTTVVLVLSMGQVMGLLTNATVNMSTKNKDGDGVLTRAMRMVTTGDYVQ